MNPELYERYLAKNAKKLGISVEELKAQGTSPVTGSTEQPQTVSQSAQQPSGYQSFNNSQPSNIPNSAQSGYVQQNTQPAPVQQSFNYSAQENYPNNFQQQYTQSYPQSNQQYQQPQTVQQTEYNQPYSGMLKETVSTNVPSYVFGPSRMNDNTTVSSPMKSRPQPNLPNDIKDNRLNKFGLIGYPLGHSLSKVIHEAGFKSLGIEASYDILETPPDTLVDRIKWLKAKGYKGFNVTIPLKLPISLFVNEVDRYADLARAVNTVFVEPDRSLKAYNTDVIGFKRAIPADIDLRGKKVGILGTGGAAHAACIALTECGVSEIAFFTRNIPNSIDLMNYVRKQFPAILFNIYQIENIRHLGEYAMLVNTTPIGMLGKAGDMMPVETRAIETLNPSAVVYDVIYNPKKTLLIKAAEKLNLRTITGLDMLIYQAVAAQEIWFGRTPDFKDMKIAALEAL